MEHILDSGRTTLKLDRLAVDIRINRQVFLFLESEVSLLQTAGSFVLPFCDIFRTCPQDYTSVALDCKQVPHKLGIFAVQVCIARICCI